MRRRDLLSVLGFIIAVFMFTSPVILSAAYDEYIEVTIANNNTSSYDNLPIMIDINNSQLSDYGYILATGLDTNWATGASNAVYSLSNNKAFVFTSSILSNQQVVYNYQLGYSPAQTSYPVMTGYGGYLTVADAATLELGNDFEIELSGYIDTSSGSSKYLVNKSNSILIYISNTCFFDCFLRWRRRLSARYQQRQCHQHCRQVKYASCSPIDALHPSQLL